MEKSSVLVTGGVGYIGSHVVRQLVHEGYEVVVYDNLSTGSPQAFFGHQLVVGDLANLDKLYQLFAAKKFDAVFHFAASIIVPESIQDPLSYYENNSRNTLNLLRCCQIFKVKKFIFSSTAAVYGNSDLIPIREDSLVQPINPYGRSKMMSELMIQDHGASSDFKYIILRYFNVAGASLDNKLGQCLSDSTHLIRAVCDAALKRKPSISIFGTDYKTVDGTGVRDYIHVEDLASAHLAALKYLNAERTSQIVNCGYGRGYSVREIINRMKEISGLNFLTVELGRRSGDPGVVIASSDKIQGLFGWRPKFDCLDITLGTTLLWEIKRETSYLDLSSWSSNELDALNKRVTQYLMGIV